MKWILSTLLFTVIYISSYGQAFDINFNDTTYMSHIFIDTVNCHRNLWQVGRPHKTVFDSASSVTNVIVTDTSLTYAANDTSIFILKVPSYYGGPISTLSPIIYSLEFNYWLNLDSNANLQLNFPSMMGLPGRIY